MKPIIHKLRELSDEIDRLDPGTFTEDDLEHLSNVTDRLHDQAEACWNHYQRNAEVAQ